MPLLEKCELEIVYECFCTSIPMTSYTSRIVDSLPFIDQLTAQSKLQAEALVHAELQAHQADIQESVSSLISVESNDLEHPPPSAVALDLLRYHKRVTGMLSLSELQQAVSDSERDAEYLSIRQENNDLLLKYSVPSWIHRKIQLQKYKESLIEQETLNRNLIDACNERRRKLQTDCLPELRLSINEFTEYRENNNNVEKVVLSLEKECLSLVRSKRGSLPSSIQNDIDQLLVD